MSSLRITNNASLKTMKKEVLSLERFCAAQLLAVKGNWSTQTPDAKGPSHFAKAKFYAQRFNELLAMPTATDDPVLILALRACHSKLFAEAVRIDLGD